MIIIICNLILEISHFVTHETIIGAFEFSMVLLFAEHIPDISYKQTVQWYCLVGIPLK